MMVLYCICTDLPVTRSLQYSMHNTCHPRTVQADEYWEHHSWDRNPSTAIIAHLLHRPRTRLLVTAPSPRHHRAGQPLAKPDVARVELFKLHRVEVGSRVLALALRLDLRAGVGLDERSSVVPPFEDRLVVVVKHRWR